jgi:hypothetical protein
MEQICKWICVCSTKRQWLISLSRLFLLGPALKSLVKACVHNLIHESIRRMWSLVILDWLFCLPRQVVVWLCFELVVICCLQDITREVNLLKEAMHSEGFMQVAEKKRSCISDHWLFFQPVHVIECPIVVLTSSGGLQNHSALNLDLAKLGRRLI